MEISGISSTTVYAPYQQSTRPTGGTLSTFDIVDEAIISEKAKMLNKLEEYNAGKTDEIDLALTTATSEIGIEANLRVFESENEMMKKIVHLGEDEEVE